MKRVLAYLVGLSLAAVVGLELNGFFRDTGFLDDHPPPGKQVGPTGERVHFIESEGKSETAVVFFHGDPGTSLDFAPVQARLSPEVHSFAFDRPGYGWSERPQAVMGPRAQAVLLHGAVKALGLKRPVVVGFSYGGPVALAYALEFPDEVGALVLVAPVADPVEGHPMHGAQARLVTPVVGPLIAYGAGPLVAPKSVEAGFVDAFYPQPPDPKVVELGKLHFTRASVLLASARDWEALKDELPSLAKRYESIDVPVELVWGKDDRIVSERHPKYLLEHVKGARLMTVESCGHQMMSTHPEDVVEAVKRGLARVQP